MTSPEISPEPVSPDRLTELAKFRDLRLRVLAEQERVITERIMTNPVPDEEEFSAGAFREQIEPQCRDAIFAMRRKGYRTGGSGFGPAEVGETYFSGAMQIVAGGFGNLDPETAEMLHNEGYTVDGSGVSFLPPAADMDAITAQWDHLADILPSTGRPVEPNMRDMDDFWYMVEGTTPWIDWSQVPHED